MFLPVSVLMGLDIAERDTPLVCLDTFSDLIVSEVRDFFDVSPPLYAAAV